MIVGVLGVFYVEVKLLFIVELRLCWLLVKYPSYWIVQNQQYN